jgi:hypothetical protein
VEYLKVFLDWFDCCILSSKKDIWNVNPMRASDDGKISSSREYRYRYMTKAFKSRIRKKRPIEQSEHPPLSFQLLLLLLLLLPSLLHLLLSLLPILRLGLFHILGLALLLHLRL